MSRKEGTIFGYKSSTGRINPVYSDDIRWVKDHFEASVGFELLPNEIVTHTGLVQFGRWFWTKVSTPYEAIGVIRNKDGSVNLDKLPELHVTFSWFGPSVDSEPRSTAYQAPHGPDEPCTCKGCWACDGFEMDCTCDIDWEAMREAKEMEWLESQS